MFDLCIKRSQNSWWKVVLDHPAKIYLTIIEWRLWANKEANVLVTLGLQDDSILPDFEKKLKILSTWKSVVICDPPTLARYVKVERKGEDLQLREVNIYAAGNLLWGTSNDAYSVYCCINAGHSLLLKTKNFSLFVSSQEELIRRRQK